MNPVDLGVVWKVMKWPLAASLILLLSRVSGGIEELEQLLTGNILNVSAEDVGRRAILFLGLGGFYAAFHRKFALISKDPEAAVASGMRVRTWDFLFYAAFALIVVSFVRVAGLLLTFSYLIVPAVCACGLALTVVNVYVAVLKRR
ncbi:MAG: hypothetical protein CK531_09480 [Gemmatimonadetes bacterium]|nr:MAG: hypothetical protein CK531_09480 [Gemmatimonadota bacterium]